LLDSNVKHSNIIRNTLLKSSVIQYDNGTESQQDELETSDENEEYNFIDKILN